MYRGYDGAGVSYTELEVLPDFSSINTLSTGIIGGASRGPLTKTKITNAKQLRKIFGDPVEGDWGLWAAMKVLKNSNLIWYKRVISDSARKGIGAVAGKSCKYVFETLDYDEYLNGAKITVSVKPGTSRNETKVNDETLVKVVKGGTNGVALDERTVTIQYSASTAKSLSLAEGERVKSITKCYAGNAVYVEGTDFDVDYVQGSITWISGGAHPSTEGSNVTLVFVPETVTTYSGDVIPLNANQGINTVKKIYATVDGITYEYTDGVDYEVNLATGVVTWFDRGASSPVTLPVPGTQYTVQFVPETIQVISELDRYDVVLTKNGGILEKLTNLTTVPGNDDYIVDAMKVRSDYLTCYLNEDFDESATNAYPDLNGTYVISGGDAGIRGLAEHPEVYVGQKGTDEGVQDFLDPEALDISTLIIPGVFDDLVIQAATDVAEARGDIIYVADMPEGLTPQQADKFSRRKGDWTPTLSNKLHVIDSKFVAMYYPWVLEYVSEWNKNCYTPPSGWVAAQFAYNDTVAQTWFAPAGFQSGTQGRGVLTSALGLEHNCTQAERDILYADDNGCVNPIVGFVGKGITLWGNKTCLRTGQWASADSSWTQLSVRRLCNYCRKVIIKASMETLFQPNTETYWKQWRIKVETELRRIQEGDGIEKFRVQMDRSTISDEDLYYGRAPGKVFILPVHAIEWIPITFTVTHDRVIFEEGNTSVEE